MSLTKASYSMISSAPVSVLDFGADPTGVADSTSAIQAAIDYAGTNFIGATVVFPNGTYLTTAPITIPLSMTLQGEGSIYGASFNAYAQIRSLHDGSCFVFNGATSNYYQNSGIQIVGIKIRGNRITYPNSIGLTVLRTYGQSRISECHISSFGNSCITLCPTYGLSIENCYLADATFSAIRIDCTFTPGGVSNGLYQTNVVNINNTTIQSLHGTGLYIYGPGSTINLNQCTIEGNDIGVYARRNYTFNPSGALDVDFPMYGLNITNNYFESNETPVIIGDSNANSEIRNLTLTGNVFWTDDVSAAASVFLNAVTCGVVDNAFRPDNRPSRIEYNVTTNVSSVNLYLGRSISDIQKYSGYFALNGGSKVFFQPGSYTMTTVVVAPNDVNAVSGDAITSYAAGTASLPINNLEWVGGLMRWREEAVSKLYNAYPAANTLTISLLNDGNAGSFNYSVPGFPKVIVNRNASSTSTPQFTSVVADAGTHISVDGGASKIEATGANALPLAAQFGGVLTVSNVTLNFTGSLPSGRAAFGAYNGGTLIMGSGLTNAGTVPPFDARATSAILYRAGNASITGAGDSTTLGGAIQA